MIDFLSEMMIERANDMLKCSSESDRVDRIRNSNDLICFYLLYAFCCLVQRKSRPDKNSPMEVMHLAILLPFKKRVRPFRSHLIRLLIASSNNSQMGPEVEINFFCFLVRRRRRQQHLFSIWSFI
jgi:hypothetical protein